MTVTVGFDLRCLRMDGGTQSRAVLDDEVIGEYRDLVIAGLPFKDPIVVFHDGENHWLADGFHRVKAVLLAGRCRMDSPVEVRQGTRRDAVLYSVGANAGHGLRRTNHDKRRAVETLLRDDEWSRWSAGQIADACGVTSQFVGKVRKESSPETVSGEAATTRKYVDRHGNETVMRIPPSKPKMPKTPPKPTTRVVRNEEPMPEEDVPAIVVERRPETVAETHGMPESVNPPPARARCKHCGGNGWIEWDPTKETADE